MDDKVAVIGLGRLGFPLAVALAHRGFKVFGIDIDPDVVEAVNAHRIPEHICEPGLQEMLDGTESLIGTTDMEAAAFAPISIILVSTPSRDDGSFSLMHVLTVCQELGIHLRGRTAYHTVIIASTVMPGDCDGPIRKALEETSGRKVGKDLGLCCCPEFVALGNILRGFLEPDFVVIGASDIKADFQAKSFYQKFCLNNPPIHRMSLTSAEITKIGLNVAVVTKMAMAAQITWICQRYPGANADGVLAAIGDDSRIGRAFFAKTLWPGGPCFPRDSASFVAAAQRVDQPVPVAEATNDYLHVQIAEMADWLESLADGQRIGVLGLTYKTGVSVTDDSYGLALAALLGRREHEVKTCDPYVSGTMALEEIVAGCEILVVTVDHAEFRTLEEMDLRGKTVVDCRGFLNEDRISGRYVRQGRGA